MRRVFVAVVVFLGLSVPALCKPLPSDAEILHATRVIWHQAGQDQVGVRME